MSYYLDDSDYPDDYPYYASIHRKAPIAEDYSLRYLLFAGIGVVSAVFLLALFYRSYQKKAVHPRANFIKEIKKAQKQLLPIPTVSSKKALFLDVGVGQSVTGSSPLPSPLPVRGSRAKKTGEKTGGGGVRQSAIYGSPRRTRAHAHVAPAWDDNPIADEDESIGTEEAKSGVIVDEIALPMITPEPSHESVLPKLSEQPFKIKVIDMPHAMKIGLDLTSKLMYFIRDAKMQINWRSANVQIGVDVFCTVQVGFLQPCRTKRSFAKAAEQFFQFFQTYLLMSATMLMVDFDQKTFFNVQISVPVARAEEMSLALDSLMNCLLSIEDIRFLCVGSRARPDGFANNAQDAVRSTPRDYDAELLVKFKSGFDFIASGRAVARLLQSKSLRIIDSVEHLAQIGESLQPDEPYWSNHVLCHEPRVELTITGSNHPDRLAESRRGRRLTLNACQMLFRTPKIGANVFEMKFFRGISLYFGLDLDFINHDDSLTYKDWGLALADCAIRLQSGSGLSLCLRLFSLMQEKLSSPAVCEQAKVYAVRQCRKKMPEEAIMPFLEQVLARFIPQGLAAAASPSSS